MVRRTRTLHPQPIFDQRLLPSFLEQNKFKSIHAQAIWRDLSHNITHSFPEIPNLPLRLQQSLRENFTVCTLTLSEKQISKDGTIKLLFKTQDGHGVESVIMKHKGRNTLCVSSQVGCQMGCTFCATGTMGIIADLCSGEILEQLALANTFAKIRNVVFMGMGEPLQNYDQVIAAIKAMTSVFGLAPKHVTLSTVGVIHRIQQLYRDVPLVRLALSLHAPTQELRSQIVPSSKAFPLEKLMQAIDDHLASREHRVVLIEYCMLKGINDSMETAHLLGKLLQDRSVHINLIPYNTTDVDAQFSSPSDQDIRNFQSILRQDYNLKATVRENHGMDIEGACGQLALKTTSQQATSRKNDIASDIEDLGFAGTRVNNANTRGRTSSTKKSSVVSRCEDVFFAYRQPLGIALIGASIVCFTLGASRARHK